MLQESENKALEQSLKRAAHLINIAKRPVLYVGQGVLRANAEDVLRSLANKAYIPVTTTLQGLGAFDEFSELSLHMLGMHGSAYANLAMQKADLIIAVGSRFDDRVTGDLKKFAPEARKAESEGRGGIIQFDILPKNINKVVKVTESIGGDCADNLAKLLPLIEPRKSSEREAWFAIINEWKRKYPFIYEKAKAGCDMKPQTVLEELDRQCKDIKHNVIVTTGVGQHQMWAAQYFRWRFPRTFITSGGLGTMGFGLPSAIGAKVACPEKVVIDIDGDGSFCMTAMELATAAEYNIGVKVLLLNNNFQGMVKQWQDLFYSARYSATAMKNPDFVMLAEAMHVKGLRVTKEEDLAKVMQEFLECPGPVLLEALVEKNEHVFPMVPAGKGLHEMVISQNVQLN